MADETPTINVVAQVTTTPDPFDAKLDIIEQRAKRLFAAMVSIAGALALTIISVLAAWHSVLNAQRGVDTNTKINAEQEAHLIVNDNRSDKGGMPPPDAAVVQAAEKIAETAKEATK